MSVGIFVAIFGHLFQNGFCVAFEHSQLKEQGGVEHHVCFFLVGVNPFLLASAHALVASDGIQCAVTAIAVVAYDTADETYIGSGNPVVVIEVNGRKGRYEDLKLGI